ncbi:hypothetical protein HYX13_05885, partial [Candidatus Woesearchaeota archaeon]|nr:hypothetical protein [Candidatus Woesearchaeota archaeon]
TVGKTKEVSLHYVLGDAENELELDWQLLTVNIAKWKSPVLLVSDKPYLLTGGKSLDSFALQEIPFGQFPARKVTLTSTTEGEQEAQVSVHGQVVRFKQRLENQAIRLTIDVLPYVFLSTEWTTVTDADFIPALGQPQYHVRASADGNFMSVTLRDEEGEDFFVARLPFGESRRVLLPNGQAITVHASIDPATGEGVTLRS